MVEVSLLTDFLKHLETCGILQQLGTPEQNRVVERKRCHIVETRLTLLFHTHILIYLCVDAFCYTFFLTNRMPTHIIQNVSPFQKLFDRELGYNFIKLTGCLCFPYLPTKTKINSNPRPILVYLLDIFHNIKGIDTYILLGKSVSLMTCCFWWSIVSFSKF